MGRLLDRFRRLLQQNAIRVSAADLPVEWQPRLALRPGDRLEIGGRRFRVGAPDSGPDPGAKAGWFVLGDEDGPPEEIDGEKGTWLGRIEGRELLLHSGEGPPIRLPIEDLLIYPSGSDPGE